MDYKPVTHDHAAFLKKALKRQEFKEAYEGLEEEYALAREMLAARSQSGLSLEAGGKHAPSLTTLKKYAHAVGCRLEIRLIPDSLANE